jgi:hypothetical protein
MFAALCFGPGHLPLVAHFSHQICLQASQVFMFPPLLLQIWQMAIIRPRLTGILKLVGSHSWPARS